MRVAEIAELTGTTVRTVRYYHSLGLLPVPGERGGWRDYDLSHVARLSRIRWLVQAGVSLETIRRVLDESEATGVEQPDDAPAAGTVEARAEAGSVVEDLAGALAAVEDHLAEVTRQRDMLAGLLERARTGSTVSPMSPRMAAFFDRLEQAAADEATRCAVRKERDLTDLACYRGQMPPEAEFLFVDPDPDYDAESLALYSQDPADLSEAQIEQRAQVMVSRMEARLPPERLAALAGSVGTESVRGLFGLIGALSSTIPIFVIFHQRDLSITMNEDLVSTVVGIIAVSALAAPWGTCFGWLLRRTLPVILLLVAWTTYIEPAIVRALPNDLGQYLPGGLQLTLIKDATAVGDMSAPLAAGLLVAWTVGLSIIATAVTKMGDLRA